MTIPERPDLAACRKHASMTNWHKEAEMLALCDYVEHLEEAIAQLPAYEDEGGHTAGLAERCTLAAADLDKAPNRTELELRLEKTEADNRLHYKHADLRTNSVLAIEQTALYTRANTLRWVLGLPERQYHGKD